MTCKTCAYRIDKSCYRYPPTPQLLIQIEQSFTGPKQVQAVVSIYPGVEDDTNACGEYEENHEGYRPLYDDDGKRLLS